MGHETASGQLPHVVFYTKPGCHLCDEAEKEMVTARCDDEYSFEKINIETDPALMKRFGSEIPVIAINGDIVFKCTLTSSDFRLAIMKFAKK